MEPMWFTNFVVVHHICIISTVACIAMMCKTAYMRYIAIFLPFPDIRVASYSYI